MSAIQFFVRGHPVGQGSKRHVGRGILIESSKDLQPWRQAIAHAAAAEANGSKLTGPLELHVCFWFQRPSSHFGTGRNAGYVKGKAPSWREQNPDLDKLLRALFDGLTASGIIRDDRFIARVVAEKRFGDPGVLVEVRELG